MEVLKWRNVKTIFQRLNFMVRINHFLTRSDKTQFSLFELSGYISDNKILSIFKTWSRRTHMASLDVITYSGRNKYKHYPYVLSEREVTNSCSTHIKRLTVVVVDLGLPPHPHPATCSLSLLIRTGRENNIENSCHLSMSLHSLWEQNYTTLENYLVKIR